MSKLSLDVIIIAQDEEDNISHAVTSVKDWANQVFVVDSFSTDRTQDLAEAAGAYVYLHDFQDWGSQRNWALDNLPLKSEWVFFLDADEVAPSAFKITLTKQLSDHGSNLSAFAITHKFFFLNRELKYAYRHPPLLRIIKRGLGQWETHGAREYCCFEGKLGIVPEPLIHFDRRGIDHWINKHLRNAHREAKTLLDSRNFPLSLDHQNHLERKERLKWRNMFERLVPSYCRPFVYFFYRYFLSLGFLDCKAGFVYCFLHAFWYQLMIAVYLDPNYLKKTFK